MSTLFNIERMGQSSTFPTATATKKQPKAKKQIHLQPEHGMGTLRHRPPTQKEKKDKTADINIVALSN